MGIGERKEGGKGKEGKGEGGKWEGGGKGRGGGVCVIGVRGDRRPCVGASLTDSGITFQIIGDE